MQHETNAERLFSMAKMCDLIGPASRWTVLRLVESGQLAKPIKLNGRLFWRESDFTKMVARQEAERVA